MRRLLLVSILSLLTVLPVRAQEPVPVVRVIDGDTVDVLLGGQVERLRLIGLDTPEVVDPRTVVQCFGLEASARARELLDGQLVTVELDPSQGERDTFGRLLAYVYLPDGQNFAEFMIAEGYGSEYTFRTPYLHRDAFRAAQDWARTNGLGLWAAETCAGDPTRPADVVAPPAPEPVAPAPAPAAPVAPAPPAAPALRYDPFGPDRDCGHFRTQAEAQAFFLAAGGPARDPHRLDSDRDGIACETLP